MSASGPRSSFQAMPTKHGTLQFIFVDQTSYVLFVDGIHTPPNYSNREIRSEAFAALTL
jgi:hypothetical protein